MKKAFSMVLACLLMVVILTGCKKDTAPADTMEDYMTALSEKNEYQIEKLSCNEYLDESRKMVKTLSNVDVVMLGLKCKILENDGTNAKVKCQADFTATQSGYSLGIDLTKITYLLSNVDGNWLVCGEEYNDQAN